MPEVSRGYKRSEENRLSGEEIRNLFIGRTITGFDPASGNQWWLNHGKDNKWKLSGHWEMNGTYRIDGDQICRKDKLRPGAVTCISFYRNPDGSPEEKTEYDFVSGNIYPFSIEN